MRRLFVLFLVFLIPLQFLDESFDDLMVPPAIDSSFSIAVAASATTEPTAGKAGGKFDETGDSSSSSAPHADLSDSVVMPEQWPSVAPALVLVAVAAERSLPLRVFPVLEPPKD